MLSPSLEDYLEEIFNFNSSKDKVKVKDIADKLHVSSPSVVKALDKLEKQGYIIYIKYKNILLTDKGYKYGNFLVERNSILRKFFIMINSDCNPIDEAEAVEHYLSPSTLKMISNLYYYFEENEEIYNNFLEYSKDTDEKNSKCN